MKWNKASFGISAKNDEDAKPDNLTWTLSNLDCIKNQKGNTPILLFIESKETIKSTSRSKRKSAPKQTIQYKNSVRTDAAVFMDDKYRLPITSGLFTCLRMEVTEINEKQNKALNSADAPLVAIYSKDGELQGYCKGNVSVNSVYGYMRKLMRPQGVDLDKMYREVYALLDNLYRAEVKVYGAKQDVGKEQFNYNKLKRKSPSAKARVARAKKKVDDYQAESAKVKEECRKIIQKYADMAKDDTTT